MEIDKRNVIMIFSNINYTRIFIMKMIVIRLIGIISLLKLRK